MSAATRLLPRVRAEAPALRRLRDEVREFLAEQRATGAFTPTADSWLTAWDEDFSRALGARGWLGMTLPQEYGGHGRSFEERFVVTEELLAAGAPVAAHWIADRQSAQSILRFGNEKQKQKYLPGIARGEVYFAIGMSEPESGSDLASVRTRAVRVEGGWSVSGSKVWTSGAHRADAFIVLVRSAPLDTAHRHAGLSQFIIDFDQSGVDVRPIVSMNGSHHFNEVFLEDVFVPDDMVLGEPGDGWMQVTSELGFERSGPERLLSTFPLLSGLVDEARDGNALASPDIGRAVARTVGLRKMSSAVAGALERREPADVSAALVKTVGTTAEGDIAELADSLIGDDTAVSAEFAAQVQRAVDQRPGFTLRGGTNEVLRGVIARGLGLR